MSIDSLSKDSVNKLLLPLVKTELDNDKIIKKLQLDWPTRKMTTYLKKLENIEVLKSKPLKFQLKNNGVKTLF